LFVIFALYFNQALSLLLIALHLQRSVNTVVPLATSSTRLGLAFLLALENRIIYGFFPPLDINEQGKTMSYSYRIIIESTNRVLYPVN